MRTILGQIEIVTWIVAFLGLGYCVYALAVAKRTDAEALQFVHQAPGEASGVKGAGTGSSGGPDASGTLLADQILGRLKIEALGLDVPIVVGINEESLMRGVGHIEGTAYPGGLGTVGLAGHRDTFLRRLENVESGMDVRLTDGTGTYHYQVDRTEIVLPEQVSVLGIRSRPELALITCYPFRYIGPAPKRFVMHAHLVSVTPERR